LVAKKRRTPLVPHFLAPPPWTNQDLWLYHGTLLHHAKDILKGVDLARSKPRTDFGRGFYTTTLKRQARAWAWTLSLRSPGTVPAIIQFTVDRNLLSRLDTLWFVRGNFDAADFWSLVHHCRGTGGPHRRGLLDRYRKPIEWYVVVVGPVAAFWQQRAAILDADQASFHTKKAAKLLNDSHPVLIPW
jgi:Protein of unknown function (DUF3990)